jgi:hypothetical protein
MKQSNQTGRQLHQHLNILKASYPDIAYFYPRVRQRTMTWVTEGLFKSKLIVTDFCHQRRTRLENRSIWDLRFKE